MTTAQAVGVRFVGITKRFPGIVALRNVSFDVAAGSCHAVCGENGAGKSTLGKILAGLEHADEGEVMLGDHAVRFAQPHDARMAGVAMVHQELAFCENLSVAEHLCLGALPARRTFVDRDALVTRARDMLADLGVSIDPDRSMAALSVAEQQLVQIAAAVGSGARVLVFDEPTSSLAEGEAANLYALMQRLGARGVTQLFVSHWMQEIFRLCDTITVLRDGEHVATRPTASLDEGALVHLMIGRRIEQYFPKHVERQRGAELLRVERLTHRGRFHDVSFAVHAGEVVGLAGLVGAGRSEVAQALFGLDPEATGEIHVGGKRAKLRTPRDAMALGIGLVPEDRKRLGLVLSLLARENASLPILESFARRTIIDRARERAMARDTFERLGMRWSVAESVTAALSGGNQQRVVLAKWLAARSRILILDEPTRGVDVGAKAELHAWIDRLASEGAGVLLISSELPELLALSSRILVLRGGRITAEVPRARAAQDVLLRLMAGLDGAAAVA